MDQDTLNSNFSALCELWSRQQDSKTFNDPSLDWDPDNGKVVITAWNNTTTQPSDDDLKALSIQAASVLQAQKKEIAKASIAILPRTTSSSIVTPTTGMLVFDPVAQCLKTYTGTEWKTIAFS